MSISYSSALSRNGKGQLYGSEDWLSNKHVAKEPNRAEFTRQKDQFFENSRFVQAFNDSGSRISEDILPYARGINPLVSVSFSNSDGRPVKLPNKILENGAFRPPIRKIEEIVPLSRLPIGNYSVHTSPSIQVYKAQPLPLNYRAIIEAKPLATYNSNFVVPDYTPKNIMYILDDNSIKYSIETSKIGGKIAGPTDEKFERLNDPLHFNIETAKVGDRTPGAAPVHAEPTRETTQYSIETIQVGGKVAGADLDAKFARLDPKSHYNISSTKSVSSGQVRVPHVDPVLAPRRVNGSLFRAGGKTTALADTLFSAGGQVDTERGKRVRTKPTTTRTPYSTVMVV